MSESPDEAKTESDNSTDSAMEMESVSAVITDLISGSSIPEPIRKNLFKVLGQLCTAALEVPVAHLEGLVAEKRAETSARVKIISTGGEQLVNKLDVKTEYADAAARRYGQKIIREQINLDKIVESAATQVKKDAPQIEGKAEDSTEVNEINDDWLNTFEREASQKSTEEMQNLFGRILAGEIEKPSSFSVKTVKLVANLDNATAILFRKLCSLCSSLQAGGVLVDARVISVGGSAGSNSLQRFGLSFDQLNELQEYGLIISDYNSWMDYRICIANQYRKVNLPFRLSDRHWGLLPNSPQAASSEYKVHGVALSRSGKELLSIVDVEPNPDYISALQQHFASSNLQMLEIG